MNIIPRIFPRSYRAVAFAAGILVGMIITSPLRAADGFEFDVLARSGANLTIQGAPTIDDKGRVAFVGNDGTGDGIWISGLGSLKKITPALPGITIHPAIKMNNTGKVVSRTLTEGKTWVTVWDVEKRHYFKIVQHASPLDFTYCSGGILAGKPCSSIFNCPGFAVPGGFIGPAYWPCGHPDKSPYNGLSFPALNDFGKVAFYGFIQGQRSTNFLIVSSKNTEMTFKLNFVQIKAPVLANNDYVVANHGPLTGREPIMLYPSPMLENGFMVAGVSNGFPTVGVLPGINDNGSYVAFWGDLVDTNWAAQFETDLGPGIFVYSIKEGTLRRALGVESAASNELARVTGFIGNERVSINNAGYISFLGFDVEGHKTVFVARVDLRTGRAKSADIRAVVAVGDTITNLTGVVSDVALWDGLNNRNKSGDIAFLVTMQDGSNTFKAVVRAGDNCAACNCRPGQTQLRLGSVDLKIGLGNPIGSDRSSFLRLHRATPSSDLASPSALSLGSSSGIAVIRANGAMRQIRTGTLLADIIVETPYRYSVRFFLGYSQPDPVSRLSTPSGAPFSVVTVENPDGSSANNRLRVVQNGVEQGTYQFNNTLNQWELITGFGNGARTECILQSTNDGLRMITRLVSKARQGGQLANQSEGEILSRTVSLFRSFPWGEELVESREGIEPAKVTTYRYYDDSQDPNYGHLRSVVYPNGRWEFYKEYNAAGTAVKSVSQFLNNSYSETTNWPDASNRSFEVNAGDGLEMRTEYLQGHPISRRWRVELPGDESWNVVATSPAITDYRDPSNLITRRLRYSETTPTGAKAGETSRVVNPDGTLSVYAYYSDRAVDPANPSGPLVQVNRTLTWSGAPNAEFTLVTNGVTSEEVSDLAGNLFSRKEWDIASDALISRESVTRRDEFGRAIRTEYLDGTYTSRNYSCCGLADETDREGITTTYGSDHTVQIDLDGDGVKEMYYGSTVTRGGISTHSLTDALGRAFKTIIQGTNGALIVQDERKYSASGDLEWSRDAMGRQTSYDESTQDGFTLRKTTFPDGSQSIESTYQDGSVYETRGNAIQGFRYSYEMRQDNSVWVQATTQTRLEPDGALSPEYTTTYTDFAGRSYKTEYPWPDGSGPVFAMREYNAKGQPARSIDPDGLTTLYAYNGRGDLETTAVDLGNPGAIDFAGTDRITRTTALVENSVRHGMAVRKTVTEVWETNAVNRSSVVQISETSVDGAQTWITQYGLTTHTTTATDRANQSRTITTRNPDGTSTLTVFAQGRHQSSTRFDRNGTRLSQVTFAYDVFGRLASQTDARNGTTTYSYFDDGQVRSVTTPDPDPTAVGPGNDPQTTRYIYFRDAANGIKTVTTLPDGGVVTQEYFPGGQLKKTWGARTYPAEYTYDRAGRMATLTTWQQFDFATGMGIAGAATTRWNYNARGLLANKRYVDNKGPSYTHTAGGKLKTRLWARGVLTSYGYDSKTGELLTTWYSDTTPAVTNTYDRLGRLASVTDAAGLRTFGYRRGQTVTESYGQGLFEGITLVREYDDLDRQSALSVTSPTGAIYHVTYGYDAASRLHAVTSGVDVATYAYHPESSLVHTLTQSRSNAVRLTTTKIYDGLGRLRSITSVPSADSPIIFAYDYNDANQRTRATLVNGEHWTYGYDSLGQVTNGIKRFPDGTAVPGYNFGYQFDHIGNRLLANRDGKVDVYTNNLLNQIAAIDHAPWMHILGQVSNSASITVNGQAPVRSNGYFYAQLLSTNEWNSISVQGLAGALNVGAAEEFGSLFQQRGPVRLLYDDDGNQVSDGNWAMTWDAENRVVSKESLPTASKASRRRIEYVVDFRGKRVVSNTSEYNPSASTMLSSRRYLANRLELLAEMDTAANNVRKSYTWGLDLDAVQNGQGGVGGLLLLNSPDAEQPAAHLSAFDGNGNVLTLIEAVRGIQSVRYEYDPFGNSIRSSGAAAILNSFDFSTKFREEKTTDVHYEYRDLTPVNGRWLSRDPLGETDASNLYLFTRNNPVSHVDPLGLWVGEKSYQILDPSDSYQEVLQTLSLLKFGPPELQFLRLFKAYWPGGNDDANNRWVFTCRFGWIDKGHFFGSALAAYVSNSKFAFKAGYVVEDIQQALYYSGIAGVKGFGDSNYTPEDLPSDLLGSKFGAHIASRVFKINVPFIVTSYSAEFYTRIAEDWNAFLQDAGAVAKDPTTIESLLSDSTNMRAEGVRPSTFYASIAWQKSARGERYRAQAYRCLCDPTTDLPKRQR